MTLCEVFLMCNAVPNRGKVYIYYIYDAAMEFHNGEEDRKENDASKYLSQEVDIHFIVYACFCWILVLQLTVQHTLGPHAELSCTHTNMCTHSLQCTQTQIQHLHCAVR